MIVRSNAMVFLCLLSSVVLMSNVATADGPRLRLFQKRSVETSPHVSTQNDLTTSIVRSSDASAAIQPTSRASRGKLPSGRNYYQGKYYGNFNNRFYGPQYGYF